MSSTVHPFQGKIQVVFIETLHVLKQVEKKEWVTLMALIKSLALSAVPEVKNLSKIQFLNGLDLLRGRNPVRQFWISAEWFGPL